MERKVKRQDVVVCFIVEGSGDFPSDMLRYDCCFPVVESEARGITTRHDKRQVTLEHRGNGSAPTVARWSSFGWRVIDPSLETPLLGRR